MVGWKLYIDSPQQKAFDSYCGSLTEGNGHGDGDGIGDGDGDGWGNGWSGGRLGDGRGGGIGSYTVNGNADGGSATVW